MRDPTLFGGWLKRIVINKSIQTVKNSFQVEEYLHDEKILEEENETWFNRISFEKLQEEIQQLPSGCRQIFTLYLLENYKHREIAEVLNISVSNSKSQYQYALKLLRQRLQRYLI